MQKKTVKRKKARASEKSEADTGGDKKAAKKAETKESKDEAK